MKLKASQQFVVGKNNIIFVWSGFKDHFSGMNFESTKPILQHKTLDKAMNDKEILDQFRPEESSLGDFLFALNNEVSMLKNGYANIFYIRDDKGILWAVRVLWYGGGWNVYASSIESSSGWGAGYQVFGRGFLESLPFQALESFDPLKLKFSYGGKDYKIVEN